MPILIIAVESIIKITSGVRTPVRHPVYLFRIVKVFQFVRTLTRKQSWSGPWSNCGVLEIPRHRKQVIFVNVDGTNSVVYNNGHLPCKLPRSHHDGTPSGVSEVCEYIAVP